MLKDWKILNKISDKCSEFYKLVKVLMWSCICHKIMDLAANKRSMGKNEGVDSNIPVLVELDRQRSVEYHHLLMEGSKL